MKGCATARFRPTAKLATVGGDVGPVTVAAAPPVPEARSRRISACLWFTAPAVFAILLALSIPAHARPRQHHGEHASPHTAMGAPGHRMGGGFQHQNPQDGPQRLPEPVPQRGANPGRSTRVQQHPGAQHLSEWFQNHQHMSLKQQERALRRQPGFNRLSPAQRRRVLNRLRFLDSQPPAVRARILARNEAFERLSPERKQEVRAAAQAFQHMPQQRKEQLGRAFHILRTLPPDERTAILHSARFQNQYSPRERHILGNLLSIEPWQPPQPPPPSSTPRH